jgi:RNA polymerase sigma factor (sigma-70 family)
MGEQNRLAERFETHRDHLQAVAYQMLGSDGDADDAVQEAWLRLSRSNARRIENLAGWLTTVVARVCLDKLRSRTARREKPLGLEISETVVSEADGSDPAQAAVQTDSVGRALLVVMDTLTPAERVAFVLHDLFAVPFKDIGPIIERSTVATKKLASRARHRVKEAGERPDTDRTLQRQLVDAFISATRGGDVETLLAMLAPDVVRRADREVLAAGAPTELRGAQSVAEETSTNSRRARFARPALVNGDMGIVVAPGGRLLAAIRLTIKDTKITEIDVIGNPARLRELDLAVLETD